MLMNSLTRPDCLRMLAGAVAGGKPRISGPGAKSWARPVIPAGVLAGMCEAEKTSNPAQEH